MTRAFIIAAAFAAGFIAGVCFGAPQGQAIARPIDAAAWALEDSESRGGQRDVGVLYVWIPPWMVPKQAAQVNSLAVNTGVSRSNLIALPEFISDGWLLRWDFRGLANNQRDLQEIVIVKAKLALTDPYFHERGGNSALHAGPAFRRLQIRLNTRVPIVRADWLLTPILTTDDGGFYYEFQDIKTQAGWFRNAGIDDRLSQLLNADQRVLMHQSQFTGNERRIDGFNGPFGEAFLTHDAVAGETNAAKLPSRNALAFIDAGREGILRKANGLHSFIAVNNNGDAVKFVPDTIASDTKIPPPHNRRLYVGLACMRCHDIDDGYKPATNDFKTLLTSREPRDRQLDVFGDVGERDQAAVVARLATIYGGDFDEQLQTGRDRYNKAVAKATGGLKASEASALMADQHAAYRYELVTPTIAVRELGIKLAANEDGAKAFRWLIPKLGSDGNGVSPEDPTIGALASGMPVKRIDFELVYADLATRAIPRFREFVSNAQN